MGASENFCTVGQPAAIDKQTIIRLNRDTLYSAAIFDLDAGPVTITLPEAGKRFMSMQVIDEDQYTPEVEYGAGVHTLTKQQIGTRYVAIAIRTLVDPADPKDVIAVHALQDAIKVDQSGGPGKFETPDWRLGKSKEGSGGAARAGHRLFPIQKGCSGQRSGRAGAKTDRRGFGLGRKP